MINVNDDVMILGSEEICQFSKRRKLIEGAIKGNYKFRMSQLTSQFDDFLRRNFLTF